MLLNSGVSILRSTQRRAKLLHKSALLLQIVSRHHCIRAPYVDKYRVCRSRAAGSRRVSPCPRCGRPRRARPRRCRCAWCASSASNHAASGSSDQTGVRLDRMRLPRNINIIVTYRRRALQRNMLHYSRILHLMKLWIVIKNTSNDTD